MTKRSRLEVEFRILPNGPRQVAFGRDAWALVELVAAGASGCTPITHPGPRWSAYVHALRHERGLSIETLNEGHGGPFAGTHARYILRSPVEILSRSDRDAVREAA